MSYLKKNAKLRIKIVKRLQDVFFATISAFAGLLHIDSVNDIIKMMISTNIILGWRSMMIDMAAISWVIFSHDAFVSQETFANKLCRGILAAKSEMNLDMRWDYLDVTGRTTDNLERLGWGQSQNPRLTMVSSSLNWINVFDPFCFATRCYNRSLYAMNHQNYTKSCIPRLLY